MIGRAGRLRAGTAAALLTLLTGAGCRQAPAESTPPPAHADGPVVRELAAAPGGLVLPRREGSVRFAVIGDSGRGDRAQHEVAQRMVEYRAQFPFEFVVMLGDNIYDRHSPRDYAEKFEIPYAPLLASGVEFYAAIGNHDDPGQVHYARFNMQGRRFYSFRKSERRLAGLAGAGVRFFVLDSRSLDPQQLEWLREELRESGTNWKIAYFHHPLYTSARYRATARALRLALEPILIEGHVDVVLSGHEHVYERVHPQNGIAYFVSGAAGSLRPGDVSPSPITARSFDTDYHFMLMEIAGAELYFQAISRAGVTIDAGVITRRSR